MTERLICFSENEAWSIVVALAEALEKARAAEALSDVAYFDGVYRVVRSRAEEGGVR